MSTINWNKVFEFAWRILVFIAAVAIIVIVSANWNPWDGAEGWQPTTDAYLESDLTPITSKVAGYVRDLPIQDFERFRKGQVLAQLVDDDYRAAGGKLSATSLFAQVLMHRRTVQSVTENEQIGGFTQVSFHIRC